MRHRSLFVYFNRRGEAPVVHWKRGCPLGLGGHPDRLYAFDRDNPDTCHLAERPPDVVIDYLATWLGASICAHCVPAAVLTRLDLAKPPGARAGVPLGA